MQRDMDLVRKILFETEKAPYEGGWIDLEIEGYEPNAISYHVLLLDEAGLLRATELSSLGVGPEWRPERLTWAGHEFIEAARDEGRWEKAKKIMWEKSGGMAFEVLTALLVRFVNDAVMGK